MPRRRYYDFTNQESCKAMTYEELRRKCRKIQEECEERQKDLKKQYAIENNPVKIGDVVTDHLHTIRVDDIKYYGLSYNSDRPQMTYYGIELKKNGEAKKIQPRYKRPVFQERMLFINGEKYKFGE